MKTKIILISALFISLSLLANNVLENSNESSTSQPGKRTIKRVYVEEMGLAIFSDVIDSSKRMNAECVSNPEIAEGSYIWICFLKPKAIQVNGKFQSVPPDVGEWMLGFDYKESTYELKRVWVHNPKHHTGVIKPVYIKRLAQAVLSDVNESTKPSNLSCSVDTKINGGSYIWICELDPGSPNVNTKIQTETQEGNERVIINFKENTCHL